MKIQSAINPALFGRLSTLFEKISDVILMLKNPLGTGTVRVYKLARGLQVRIWDCSFSHQLMISGDDFKGTDPAYFTLALFANTKGLTLINRGSSLPKNIVWDTIFLSDRSNCQMEISPGNKAQCLSISFTHKWFCRNVLDKSNAVCNLKEKVYNSESFSLLGSMTAAEKKFVRQLLDISGKPALGTFYLRCQVLKIICDYLVRLRDRSYFL